MNLLSTVLPAIRDVRTPTAVGALWGVLTALILFPRRERILANPSYQQIEELISETPTAYRLAALGFAVYLLGVIAMQFQSFFGRRLGELTRSGVRKLRDSLPWKPRRLEKLVRLLRRRISEAARLMDTEPPDVRIPVLDAIGDVFSRAGAPGSASLFFPEQAVFESLGTASMQLSESAPTQAQEYDRLRSEAEFRGGVALPLACLLGSVIWQVWPPLVLIALIVAGSLGWQAHLLRFRAQVILSQSVRLGYAKIPLLTSLANELSRRDPGQGASMGTWAGVTSVALDRLGALEESSIAIHEFVDFDPDESDIEDCRRYLEAHQPETARLLDSLLQRRDAEEQTDESGTPGEVEPTAQSGAAA